VEEMAAYYLREIQVFQPEGPYLLGGRCFGGLVAYEMACQLHEQGHRVPLLVLLDSSQPPPLITLRDYVPRLLFHHLPRGQLVYCLVRDVREQVEKLSWRVSSSSLGQQIYIVWNAHERARRSYLPHPYPGRITLFHTQEFQIRFPEYQARWEALAGGGVECHFIPSSHRDLLREPYVRVVAERLKARLAAVQL
jgi:aspartate racemase